MIEGKIKEKVMKIFKEADVEVKRVILFGSRARGDWKKRDSDWDLLIVVNKELAEEYIPCDVIIKSEKEIEYYKDFFWHGNL